MFGYHFSRLMRFHLSPSKRVQPHIPDTAQRYRPWWSAIRRENRDEFRTTGGQIYCWEGYSEEPAPSEVSGRWAREAKNLNLDLVLCHLTEYKVQPWARAPESLLRFFFVESREGLWTNTHVPDRADCDAQVDVHLQSIWGLWLRWARSLQIAAR